MYGVERIFEKPLLGVARSSDYVFDTFKEAVGPLHRTPEDIWLGNGFPDKFGIAGNLRVVSGVFPYTDSSIRLGLFITDAPVN